MRKVGKYCKAYQVEMLRTYSRWRENTQNLIKERKVIEGIETEIVRELTNAHYLFLQENLVVTDGIYLDENIIFDDVTPEWEDFCRNVLNFRTMN